jgi:NADH:ubiquinone oxidoreductase subunit 5 (subunit L)/multisubunit Na+/H+ antiporter MnhA subunit
MILNVLLMFALIGVFYQSVRVPSKIFAAVSKAFVLYYLVLMFVQILSIMGHVSLGACVMLCYSLKLSVFSYYLALAITLIAFLIICNSLNYLSYVEAFHFVLLLLCFYLAMYVFVLSTNLLVLFVCWEYLGIVSYLLINYWLTRVNCGIKTLLYNRLGDVCFLLVVCQFYAFYHTLDLSCFNLHTD